MFLRMSAQRGGLGEGTQTQAFGEAGATCSWERRLLWGTPLTLGSANRQVPAERRPGQGSSLPMPTLPLPPGKQAASHGWTSPSQITVQSGTWLEVGVEEGSPQAHTLLVLLEEWVGGGLALSTHRAWS